MLTECFTQELLVYQLTVQKKWVDFTSLHGSPECHYSVPAHTWGMLPLPTRMQLLEFLTPSWLELCVSLTSTRLVCYTFCILDFRTIETVSVYTVRSRRTSRSKQKESPTTALEGNFLVMSMLYLLRTHHFKPIKRWHCFSLSGRPNHIHQLDRLVV